MQTRLQCLLLVGAGYLAALSAWGQTPSTPLLGVEKLSGSLIRISWTNDSVAPVLRYVLRNKTALDDAAWLDLLQLAPAAGPVQSVELAIAPEVPASFYHVQPQIWTPPTNLIWCSPGAYTLGSPATEPGRELNEGPQTEVILQVGFWLGRSEVTQREYLAIMGVNPSSFTGDLERPVDTVSWENAVEFCSKLTAQEVAAGRLPAGYEYRLPTEAQWEYACRAGTTTPTAFGNSLSSSQANFYGIEPYGDGAVGPYLDRTTTVGSYAANAWGFHDMHGNVWEWCADFYAAALPGGSQTDPAGPQTGTNYVIRGGGFGDLGRHCRSATRFGLPKRSLEMYLGFRVALVAPSKP